MTEVGKNTSVKALVKKDIDESNFRETAQAAIKKYFDRGNIIDGMLWGRMVALYEKVLERPQPMQPVVLEEGQPRFKANALLKNLFATGKLDLNEIRGWAKHLPIEDQEQFWQLLGYSVDGFADLSWPRQETKDLADIEAARVALRAKEKEERGPE